MRSGSRPRTRRRARREDRETPATSGGRPAKRSMPCSRIRRRVSVGSKPCWRTIVAPARRLVSRATLSPYMWEIGTTASTTAPGCSPLPGVSMTACWLEVRLPWLIIAAFGAPAVPLVKMRTARSSSETATGEALPTGKGSIPSTSVPAGVAAGRVSGAGGGVPVNRSCAPTQSTWSTSSAGAALGSSSTTAIPAELVPRMETTVARVLVASTATRSPARNPWAMSPSRVSATRSRSSP